MSIFRCNSTSERLIQRIANADVGSAALRPKHSHTRLCFNFFNSDAICPGVWPTSMSSYIDLGRFAYGVHRLSVGELIYWTNISSACGQQLVDFDSMEFCPSHNSISVEVSP